MMTTDAYWKDKIDDLRGLAAGVIATPEVAERMTARTAAKCLAGIVSLVARRWTVDIMQRTCAELVRCEAAWATAFGRLPLQGNGLVAEQTMLVAVVARALLPLAGAEHVRSALSFWATEDDPGVWTSVTAPE